MCLLMEVNVQAESNYPKTATTFLTILLFKHFPCTDILEIHMQFLTFPRPQECVHLWVWPWLCTGPAFHSQVGQVTGTYTEDLLSPTRRCCCLWNMWQVCCWVARKIPETTRYDLLYKEHSRYRSPNNSCSLFSKLDCYDRLVQWTDQKPSRPYSLL